MAKLSRLPGREVKRRAGWSGRRYCLRTEKPSFFAVGRALGLHHQTVQRCVGRALAYGPLAALDDRPRPGKEPTITPEAKAWLVSWRAKGQGTRLSARIVDDAVLARHARENGRRRDTNVSPNWCRERCARYSAKRKSSRTRYGIIWNVATPSSSRRWRRFCAFIARSRS